MFWGLFNYNILNMKAWFVSFLTFIAVLPKHTSVSSSFFVLCCKEEPTNLTNALGRFRMPNK